MEVKPQNSIKLAEDTITQNELNALCDWIKAGSQLTKGPLTIEFEKKFSEYIGSDHTVLINSGSSANLLMAYALLEGGYLKNKKVVVPSVSWITTLSPFLQFGFETFLCEADYENLGVDLNHLEEIFKKEEPSLLILVHVLGHANHMAEIQTLCEKYGVLLIEDSCEALGSEYGGKKLGNLSVAGSYSFYYGHHISTIEGGAVVTNDRKLYNLMLSIRSHGWARDVDSNLKQAWKSEFDIDDFREFYTFYYPGFNLRSTDLNAFLGISQLKLLPQISVAREKNFLLYKELLGKDYWSQKSKYDILSSFAYGTFVENRVEVFNHLKSKGIETRPLICGSMGLQPFWIKKFGKQNFKVADLVHNNGLYLPNHYYLTEEKIKMVCEVFSEKAIPKFL